MALSAAIKDEASRLGFDVVGIAKALPLTENSEASRAAPLASAPTHPAPETLAGRLMAWLSHGYHATMAWMERTPERRSDPAQVLEGCRSIIAVGMNYFTNHEARETPGYGRIARYAWGKDYHTIFAERLRRLEAFVHAKAPEAKTKWYVDTGPVLEKAWAQAAGLGWIGKHSNLVSERFGSWLLLGEILTTLELEPDLPGSDLCGTCALCINACPTHAIVEPYVVNAERCLSYTTIEYRGTAEALPEDLRSRTGNHIFGCDECLDVCPYNVNARPTDEPHFTPLPHTTTAHLDTLAQLTEPEFHERFRHSAIRRAKHHGWLRNISIAQHNDSRTDRYS